MDGAELVRLSLVLAAAALGVGIGFALFGVFSDRAVSEPPDAPRTSESEHAIFLFHAGHLVDVNALALEMAGAAARSAFTWSDLHQLLGAEFPCLPPVQGTVRTRDTLTLHPVDPGRADILVIDQWEDIARVTLQGRPVVRMSTHGLSWRAVLDAPNPIWQTDSTGHVTWSNPAFDALATTFEKDEGGMRDALFDLSGAPEKGVTRIGVTDRGHDKSSWFDVVTVRSDGANMHYATDANAIVNAEIAQRNFVQTLTKTFAQLSIGLAIFDRSRQLALFNPALIDLTTLPADFLSGRPSLMAFFDRMRENRVMPEPKNYASWREQITELVVAAADGRYSETWTLPSGLTYRVTGRPHPDGAIAFLFEDISAEISLTRRFRADIELGASVLDAFDDAVVVFASDGHLRVCNKAYRALWQTDPDASIVQYALRDALPVWKAEAQPMTVWDRLRKSVMADGDRTPWRERIRLKSGQEMELQVQPVEQGATLVRFSPVQQVATEPVRELAT